MTTDLTIKQTSFSLQPKTFDEAEKLAKYIANSDFAPKDYKAKPANILIAIQMGHEVGLKPMQSLQNIAVINGRPCLWGDAMLAIVKAHSECEYINELFDQSTQIATCTIKRHKQPECTRTFSMQDAKKANLANKPGPWQQYPSRMLQLRARAFALRDSFPDALKGFNSAEEVRDYPKDSPTPIPAVELLININQLQQLKDSLDIHDVNLERFKQYFKITKLEDLACNLFDKAVSMIKGKPLKDIPPSPTELKEETKTIAPATLLSDEFFEEKKQEDVVLEKQQKANKDKILNKFNDIQKETDEKNNGK